MTPLDYMKMHNPRVPAMEEYVRGKSWRDLELDVSPKGIKARRMISSVKSEIRHMKGLVRLKPLGNAILYGYMKPHHKIMGYIAGYFAMRFPSTVIILGNSNCCHAAFYSKKMQSFSIARPLRAVIDELEGVMESKDGGADDIWRAYYSCYINTDAKAWRKMPSIHIHSAGGGNGLFPSIYEFDEHNEE